MVKMWYTQNQRDQLIPQTIIKSESIRKGERMTAVNTPRNKRWFVGAIAQNAQEDSRKIREKREIVIKFDNEMQFLLGTIRPNRSACTGTLMF